MTEIAAAKRLAIISSHPVQYNAPLFKYLSEQDGFDVKVFYSWNGPVDTIDPEFGKKITWDIPLFEGYEYCFVANEAEDPGTHHFRGLDNPRMVAQIECWHADVVLVYGWALKTHLTVLRHFHGRIPVLFRGDSTLLTGGGISRKILRRIWLTWVYRHIDIALFPGQRSKDYFLKYGVPRAKLRHLPHSIDNQRFSKNANSLEIESIKKRKKLGISKNSLVLLFAGKLVARKQPIFLLQVVRELVELEQLDIHLIFVGVGPLEKQLKLLSVGLNYVHFLGFQNQTKMPLIYRLGDVYVLPSVIETWGLGVNEAMACSRPVLVSDLVGCAPDLVVPKISGDVFYAGNIDSIKSFIRGYIDQRNELHDMRVSARYLIESWSLNVSATLMGDHILNTLEGKVKLESKW